MPDDPWTTTDPGLTYFPNRRLLDESGAAITAATPSTSPATGALTVAGGAGIAGALNVGNASSFVRVNGDMIEFYQGGVMKTRLQLATLSGLLGLLVSSGFIACDSFYGKGETSKTEVGNSGTSNELQDIAYGNGLFVAVGYNGTVLTSPDGITWTSRTSGITGGLTGVAFGNGMFVAVGFGGSLTTSPDGITWTLRISSDSGNAYYTDYANGLFIRLRSLGYILTSPDGVTWTSRTSGTSRNLLQTAYGSGLFVIVGEAGTVLTSPDGITWTSRTSGTSNLLECIAYGIGLFVAAGYRNRPYFSRRYYLDIPYQRDNRRPDWCRL
jgi:hypothetical protein